MATGKRYYWIKLKESFMSSDVVDYLMGQQDGANYVVLYQMLCLKTINTGGKLSRQIGEIIIPYDVEKIRRDCKWFSTDTIRVALNLYKSFGLIYEDQDGVLVLSDHNNLVGSETDYALQKKNQRKSGVSLPPHTVDIVVDNTVENVHTDNRDKILDKRDKENRYADVESEDIESEDISTPQAEAEQTPCPFAKIKELYHCVCVSYPQIKSIDGNRKKAVAARWRVYKNIEVFEELFKIAEASKFLKGQNNRNWYADFDWMMKPTNFSKILEHKYDERASECAQPTGAIGTLAKMYEEASESDGAGDY